MGTRWGGDISQAVVSLPWPGGGRTHFDVLFRMGVVFAEEELGPVDPGFAEAEAGGGPRRARSEEPGDGWGRGQENSRAGSAGRQPRGSWWLLIAETTGGRPPRGPEVGETGQPGKVTSGEVSHSIQEGRRGPGAAPREGESLPQAPGPRASWAELDVLREPVSQSSWEPPRPLLPLLCGDASHHSRVPTRAGLGHSHSPARKPRLGKTTGPALALTALGAGTGPEDCWRCHVFRGWVLSPSPEAHLETAK